MQYDSIKEYKDSQPIHLFNAREKILEKLDEMYSKTNGEGTYPWNVNVVTFSGHGITF